MSWPQTNATEDMITLRPVTENATHQTMTLESTFKQEHVSLSQTTYPWTEPWFESQFFPHTVIKIQRCALCGYVVASIAIGVWIQCLDPVSGHDHRYGEEAGVLWRCSL